jgi:hypothetical protein
MKKHAKQAVASARQEDFHAWLLDQAQTLRRLAPKLSSLDCAEIAEELEGMARSDEHTVQSSLEVLIVHLLKWQYQPRPRSRSWRVSVQNARSDIRDRLTDSPSLKAKVPTLIGRTYGKARRTAGAEMEFDERAWDKRSASSCPWNFEQLVSDFWPDAPDGIGP